MRTRNGRRDEARLAVSLNWLARYDALHSDPQAFRDAIAEPPPVDLLVPGSALDRAFIEQRLAERGLRAETFSWAPHHLRVRGATPKEIPEVALGLAYPQGVVSSIPPAVLEPRAGETLLDACAAPGGKTLLLSLLAGGRSRIFAGEISEGRSGVLVQSLARHAVTAAIVVRHDASAFPRVARIDGAMLDVPCSGEGTFRVPRMRYEPTGERGLARAAAIQRRILARGLDLLAPGGRLVYSTCTYAPEENEAVLTDVLAERPEIAVRPIPESFPGDRGLDSWNGTRFDPRLEGARRLAPHHTGSWGFFVALLVKDPAANVPAVRVDPQGGTLLREDIPLREQVASWLLERFGVPPEILERWHVIARGHDAWLLDRLGDEESVPLGRMQLVAPGLRAVRGRKHGFRATTSLLRRLGAHMTRGVIDLDDEGLTRALAEERVPISTSEARGQVAVRWHGRVVSGAHLGAGHLTLELPRAWR